MTEFEKVMTIWGRCWARSRIGTEYPCIAAGMGQAIESSQSYILNLDDKTCIAIEKQVMNLYKHNLLQYQILMAKFVQRVSDKDIWCNLGISRDFFIENNQKE